MKRTHEVYCPAVRTLGNSSNICFLSLDGFSRRVLLIAAEYITRLYALGEIFVRIMPRERNYNVDLTPEVVPYNRDFDTCESNHFLIMIGVRYIF